MKMMPSREQNRSTLPLLNDYISHISKVWRIIHIFFFLPTAYKNICFSSILPLLLPSQVILSLSPDICYSCQVTLYLSVNFTVTVYSFRRASTSTLTPSSEDLRALAKRSLPKLLVVVTKGKRYDVYKLQWQDHVIMSSWFLNSYHIAYVLPFSFPSLLRGGTVSSLPLSLSASPSLPLSLMQSPHFSLFLPLFLILSPTLSTLLSLSHSLTCSPYPFPSLVPFVFRFTTPNHIQIDQLDLATVQEAITSQLGPDAIEVTAARM